VSDQRSHHPSFHHENSQLPRALGRLGELANNLWWSWKPEARRLFETIDPTLWRLTHHNPVKLLHELKPERLATLAEDPVFVRQYSAVLKAFDQYLASHGTWVATQHPTLAGSAIAYFSAEFGLHNSLPIYSGGLGVLAGDHCKEASDLGLPLTGLGFMYPQGYFHHPTAGRRPNTFPSIRRSPRFARPIPLKASPAGSKSRSVPASCPPSSGTYGSVAFPCI
jgi:glucan phosphorylase